MQKLNSTVQAMVLYNLDIEIYYQSTTIGIYKKVESRDQLIKHFSVHKNRGLYII